MRIDTERSGMRMLTGAAPAAVAVWAALVTGAQAEERPAQREVQLRGFNVAIERDVALDGGADADARTSAVEAPLQPVAEEVEPAEANAYHWPQFRGPTGQGYSGATDLPLAWSEQENVVWKTPIPGRGWSSPVVWGGQIWLTTASDDGHEMFALALSRETGEVLHHARVFYNDEPQPLGNPVNSYASPTPAIEQGRVYVHFGSYGTAAIDTDTFETIWERRNLECDHYRGPGSSAILFEDTLILTMDGTDKQYLIALDTETGQTVWRTDRSTNFMDLDGDGEIIGDGDFRKAYTTPILIEHDGEQQLISPGARSGFAYAPRTGEELWHVRYRGFSNASGALYGHGMVFMNTGFGRPDLLAIRPEERGDLTDSHVAWQHNRGVPRLPSPVMVDDLIYLVSDDSGVITCIEAETGEEVWRERIGGSHSASPVHADGRIYFFSEEGVTTVIRPGREPDILARNELEDGFMASPAVSDNSLILRTRTHLYRIEQD